MTRIFGRPLKDSEARAEPWTSTESRDSFEDKRRIQEGRELEDKGYSFLADPTGLNDIREPFRVITPSNIVISPNDIVVYEQSRLDLESLETEEMEASRNYFLAYSPDFFD